MNINEVSFDTLPKAIAYLMQEVAEIKSILEKMQTPIVSTKRYPIGIDEACKIIGKAKSTVYALVRKREVPCYKTVKNYISSKMSCWRGLREESVRNCRKSKKKQMIGLFVLKTSRSEKRQLLTDDLRLLHHAFLFITSILARTSHRFNALLHIVWLGSLKMKSFLSFGLPIKLKNLSLIRITNPLDALLLFLHKRYYFLLAEFQNSKFLGI